MTIQEAIEMLEELKDSYGPDLPLWVSRDAEGNGFRPLSDDFSPMWGQGRDIEVYDPEEHEGEEISAVTLWPM